MCAWGTGRFPGERPQRFNHPLPSSPRDDAPEDRQSAPGTEISRLAILKPQTTLRALLPVARSAHAASVSVLQPLFEDLVRLQSSTQLPSGSSWRILLPPKHPTYSCPRLQRPACTWNSSPLRLRRMQASWTPTISSYVQQWHAASRIQPQALQPQAPTSPTQVQRRLARPALPCASAACALLWRSSMKRQPQRCLQQPKQQTR